MAWIEKTQLVPFEDQPIDGLYFIDGDLLPRTQEPGLLRNWSAEFQGLKYPVIVFPSGTEASVVSAAGEMLVGIHHQMRLPYFDTRDHAYERAKALIEEDQDVEKVGESDLVLRLDDAHQHLVVTYDNQAKQMIDIKMVDTATSEAENLLRLKDELLDRFAQLPPEHQATMGLVLVKTILDGQWGAWFKDALTARFRLGENTVVPPYLYTINGETLRRTRLTEEEINQLTVTDRNTIASLIHDHFLTDAFWDELEYIADMILTGKKPKP